MTSSSEAPASAVLPSKVPASQPRLAVVLAAGKGTRMRSERPKVLHPVGGRPMLEWVLAAARDAGCKKILIVVGHGAEEVKRHVAGLPDGADDIVWVEQREQLGTGHALAQTEPHVEGAATLLVLSGDVPLVTAETLDQLATAAEGRWGAAAAAELDEPGTLGRILTDDAGRFVRIVEFADAGPEELAVQRINAGLYAFSAPAIFEALRRVDTDNAQGEIYLTDALGVAAAAGKDVALHTLADFSEALGINDRKDQARVHRALLDRHLQRLMASGVTILEPARTSIEPSVTVAPETIIHPDVNLAGDTRIGSRCVLHQGVHVTDSVVDADVELKPYSLLDHTIVANECVVGPFARLRPGSVLLQGARVGNFVETKKAQLGAGAKVSHLTYLGDASVGDNANIGAGVVTCNYDGVNKHRTEIGDGAFVGSDTMLIAPVNVGADATTAAGSTVTEDVPAEALAIGRSRQRNIPGWARRRIRKN
ncbi:MAG: bifunctional UDP-N-acetylglucosamine diphosphorylase/glucosamine-1-phosphate N-acetyltransferase GlmU [Acidobacteriota bacterium]